MERFIVQIFSHGYGSHDYHIEANTAPEAVKIAKEQAKMVYPWAQSHELSAIYQGLYVNGRSQLVEPTIEKYCIQCLADNAQHMVALLGCTIQIVAIGNDACISCNAFEAIGS